MKKILSLFSAISLSAISCNSVLACSDDKDTKVDIITDVVDNTLTLAANSTQQVTITNFSDLTNVRVASSDTGIATVSDIVNGVFKINIVGSEGRTYVSVAADDANTLIINVTIG